MMEIRAARPEDAERLTEIAFSAKRHWGYPENWIKSWRDILTVSHEFIATHETFSAVIEDQPVGFYALAQKGRRIDLLHFWVLPEWMGRGIGRSLFCHAVERVKALGFQELEIESDPNAERFYLQLGARRVGTNTYAVDRQRRELPVLIYEVNPKFTDSLNH
jgi:GNAT superfamily N-acetyltransferase